MTVTKDFRGAYIISATVAGYLVTRQYLGYTKREAIAEFKAEVHKGGTH